MSGARKNTSYNDLNYTKRFDHDAGHVPRKRDTEPAYCSACNADYSGGRWSADDPGDLKKGPPVKTGRETVCPACEQERNGVPSGFVYLSGSFQMEHLDEIQNLLKNEVSKINKNNPLARIMSIESSGDEITLTTTTTHLAQHLGRAIKKAYGGDIRYDLSPGEDIARVYWNRS